MKRRRRQCQSMSLLSLRSSENIGCPPFFSFVVDDRLAACAELDPHTPGHMSPTVKALQQRGVGGVIAFGEGNREIPGLRSLNVSGDGTELSDEVVKKCITFIVETNSSGRSVVISAPSIGNTGSMLAAFLIIAERKLACEAVQLVRDRRPGAMCTADKSSLNFLMSLEWSCARKECVLIGLIWLRHRGLRYSDLLTIVLQYILPQDKNIRALSRVPVPDEWS